MVKGLPVNAGNKREQSLFLPGGPQGQRSLAGCSPESHKQSDRPEGTLAHAAHGHMFTTGLRG